MLPVEKGKGLTENKRCLNLSKYLGDEIIALFKVSGIRQNITAGFQSVGSMSTVLDKACWLIDVYLPTTEQQCETVRNYLPPAVLKDVFFKQLKEKL